MFWVDEGAQIHLQVRGHPAAERLSGGHVLSDAREVEILVPVPFAFYVAGPIIEVINVELSHISDDGLEHDVPSLTEGVGIVFVEK